MDKERQIRMLIPPFFLAASVLWLAYLTGGLGPYLEPKATGAIESLKSIVSILGLVGVATLPAGYAIGILTISILRLWCLVSPRWPFPHGNYEICISVAGMSRVRGLLSDREIPSEDNLSATAVFDHVRLQSEVHEWLLRRWNSFN